MATMRDTSFVRPDVARPTPTWNQCACRRQHPTTRAFIECLMPGALVEQQRFRVAVLLRDGHRCRRCGSNADVVAAHWPIPLRSFGADPAAYDPRHGITLCRDCHRRMDPHAY
jgi:hypothetical protein